MNSFVGRLANHNLTRLLSLGALPSQGTQKGFLLPSSIVRPVNRGAKVDCGIQWVRPVEPRSIVKAKSGDMEGLPHIPAAQLVPELEESEVLKQANTSVRKLFTFAYQPREKRKEMIEAEVMAKVKRHIWDDNSPEVKLAKMTANIRRMQTHMRKNGRDSRSAVILKEAIEKRKKRLKWLRAFDYRRFEWVLERLNLVYYPPPPKFHPVMRAVSMRQLADEFCEKIRTNRLEAYRDELEWRKPEFLKRKMETMRAIVKDEKSLKIPPSFTEDEILEVGKAYKEKVEELSKIDKTADETF